MGLGGFRAVFSLGKLDGFQGEVSRTTLKSVESI